MIKDSDKKSYLKEHLEFINKYPSEVGSKIYELEEEFRNYFQISYASACSSGSAGLLIALKALGIKKGDEVLLNCNYFISDPNSIILSGAKPIFIDLGDSLSSLSLESIKKSITKKTRAIIIVHMYGYPIENTLEIISLCQKHNIKVVEDCCQSIGSRIGNRYIGTFGDIGVFSFDTNKLVKGGEGGMLVSNNYDLIEKTRLYKNNYKINGRFPQLGYNFRYNDFSAIYAKYSLRNLKQIISDKECNAKEKGGEKLYQPSIDIHPSYYNYIIERSSSVIDKDHINDFYRINLELFPHYMRNLSKYEIIQ